MTALGDENRDGVTNIMDDEKGDAEWPMYDLGKAIDPFRRDE